MMYVSKWEMSTSRDGVAYLSILLGKLAVTFRLDERQRMDLITMLAGAKQTDYVPVASIHSPALKVPDGYFVIDADFLGMEGIKTNG